MNVADAPSDANLRRMLAAFEDELMADCPLVGYPTGWFVAAWSHEVPVGKVLPARYFGQDLVVWRGQSGQAVVMDAHCPHMGCHFATGAAGHALEHGGTVGDTIQCPFHGWRFDTEGLNVEIPYSKHHNKARAKVWPSREIYGRWILVWYDALGREPMWEPPPIPELEHPDDWFLAHDEIGWGNWGDIRQPLVCSAENAVDGGHLFYVHGSLAKESRILEQDGPVFICDFDVTFRNRKGQDVGDGYIKMEHWGMGFMVHRLYGLRDNVQIFTPTPTEGWNCVLRGMVFGSRHEGETERPEIVKRIIARQLNTANEDARVFQNQRYVRKPPYAPEEARNLLAMRKWFRQFYPLARP
jgi:phenylpropionate dioxygenase-like ring-hydroxylating dioxygenase large terminal subunit